MVEQLPEDAAGLWAECLNALHRGAGPTHRAWLAQTRAVSVVGDTLVLAVPDEFVKDWIEQRYAIAKYLIYPDALSLKHTNRHFYSIVDTGIELKIDWLMERRRLHLECPNDRRCDLGSDLRFCRGSVPCV